MEWIGLELGLGLGLGLGLKLKQQLEQKLGRGLKQGLGLGLEARCDVLGLTTPVLLRILCQLPFFGVGEGSD